MVREQVGLKLMFSSGFSYLDGAEYLVIRRLYASRSTNQSFIYCIKVPVKTPKYHKEFVIYKPVISFSDTLNKILT